MCDCSYTHGAVPGLQVTGSVPGECAYNITSPAGRFEIEIMVKRSAIIPSLRLERVMRPLGCCGCELCNLLFA